MLERVCRAWLNDKPDLIGHDTYKSSEFVSFNSRGTEFRGFGFLGFVLNLRLKLHGCRWLSKDESFLKQVRMG